jgi:flavin-binding protein dodecin
MDNSVYKKIELTGTSDKSIEEAINNAISKAAKTVRKMRWFEVVEVRGAINEDHVAQWQATVKVAFNVEEV